MTDIPTYEVHPGTPTHRSRPSEITNASAFAESTMSYGSIMSGDGLARLSQFPTPPSGFPLSPHEQSPVSDGSTMTPPHSPRRALPVPPIPPPAPLNIQKRSPPDSHPPSSLRHATNISVSHSADRPAVPPLSSGVSTISSQLSPYDWHDGSSSISADPYGEAVLSTAFITSLLSSVSAQDGMSSANPSLIRRLYEPSVVSNAMTTDSTITYPPPKAFPPPVPPLPQSMSSPTSSYHKDAIDVATSQSLQAPVPNFRPIGGRATPETVTGYDVDQRSASSATMQDSGSSRADGFGTLSITTSIQSLNSTTPLMQAFPRGDPIVEEEEPKTSSGPSTPGRISRDTRPRRSSTAYSSKTTKSYMSSLVARLSHSTGGPDRKSLRQSSAALFRKKPLPPVPPLPDIPVQDIRRAEDALPLPDLVNRAQVLSRLLDNGHRPHHSLQSAVQPGNQQALPLDFSGGEQVLYSRGVDPNLTHAARGRKGRSGEYSHEWDHEPPDTPSKPWKPAWLNSTKKRILWAGLALVIIGAIVIGVTVGVTGSKKGKHTCPGNFTGEACNLDATCVCTSTVAGQCSQLAQSLVDLVPSLNTLFNANLTDASLSTAIWQAQGTPSGSNCASQANLIDVAPALDPSTADNRTTWAQTALLWNLVQSEDLSAASTLQNFVRGADWSSLGVSDGAVPDPSNKFSIQVSGYNFDFAAQTVTALPATFRAQGQPSQAQLNEVNSVAEAALDRMYTFAQASSTQEQTALLHFWTGVLSQQASDLNTFISLIRGSPVLLPFDATLSTDNLPIANLLTNSTTAPFPPPLACYPALNSSQLQLLNTMETTVFGLPAASAASTFDTSCYPNRPIYGVLDILRLRLPFVDSRTGVAKQAAVLKEDAAPRVVVYSGGVLSALPLSSLSDDVITDPRQYGTLNNINHVLLSYLSSISDIGVAKELVQYILSSPALPPPSTNALFSAISSLPVLEVAVFGTVAPSDMQSAVSSFTDPQGSLFFGTTSSANLRDWSINAVGGEVVWTELATSSKVVRDNALTNSTFNSVWNPSFNFFHTNNSATVTVSNITSAFTAVGLFGP